MTPDGVPLGEWLRTLRKWKSAGVHPAYLTQERMEALDAIGMVWDKDDYYWDKTYQAAREYYEEHGNLDVPSRYVTKDGIRLGSWISRQRSVRAGKRAGTPPSEEQIRRLDAIGMVWMDRNERLWEQYYQSAQIYRMEHGSLDIPKSYEIDGMKLGNWLVRQKMYARHGKLSEERTNKLMALGINISAGKDKNKDGKDTDTWEYRVTLAKKYMKENNTTHISQDTIVDGIWLGKWLAVQRKALEAGKLTSEQERVLADVPLWTKKEQAWETAYRLATEYYEQHGDLNISRRYKSENGFGLGSWVSRQRQLRREGNLTEDQIRRLDAIEFAWDIELKSAETVKQMTEKIAV